MFNVLGNKPLSMKKSALLILVALFFFTCKKETEPPRTRIVVGNLKFTINPSIQPPFTYYLPINSVFLGAIPQLAAENIDTAEIKNIRPSRATLTALFGNGNLDFIQAVSIRICQLGDNIENCGQEVFYRDPTPFDVGAELELGGSAVNDVRDYVLQKEVNVQVVMESLRDIPQGTFEVVLEMEFEVR